MNLGGRPRANLKRADVVAAVRNLPLKQASDVLGVCEKTLLTYRRELGLPVGIPRGRQGGR